MLLGVLFYQTQLEPDVVFFCVFGLPDRNTAGTDLNLVFKTFLERMAVIKRLVLDEGFKEHRHVLILFTDGNILDHRHGDNIYRITSSLANFSTIFVFRCCNALYRAEL